MRSGRQLWCATTLAASSNEADMRFLGADTFVRAALFAVSIGCGSSDPPQESDSPSSLPRAIPTASASGEETANGATEGTPAQTEGSTPGPGPTNAFAPTIPSSGFFRVAHGEHSYWMRLPNGYDLAAPAPAPMVVALHGCGDTAENFAQWAAAPSALRKEQSYIAVSMDLGRNGQCWNEIADADRVMRAISDVRAHVYGDARSIHIAGFSSGGVLAYRLGLTHAAMFASVIIEHASANGLETLINQAARRVPVVVNAGKNDGVFPIDSVRAQAQTLRSAGFPVALTEHEGGHDGSSEHFVALIRAALVHSLSSR
jgi:predicted esterase